MRRVQISFDFLAVVIFVFMIFLVMFEVYAIMNTLTRVQEDVGSASRIGMIVARTINEVAMANGTSALAAIPESLDTGDSYYLSITASGRRVDVFWPISAKNRSVGAPILTNNVTSLNISKSMGSNQTTLSISNIDGLINVSVVQ